MGADLITYGLLASIFIVNGLRMFVEKPKRAFELPPRPWQLLQQLRERHRR